MATVLADIRFGARMLLKSPTMTAVRTLPFRIRTPWVRPTAVAEVYARPGCLCKATRQSRRHWMTLQMLEKSSVQVRAAPGS